MKRKKLLEFGKTGTDYDYKVPGGTSVADLLKCISLFIIDSANYRGIKSSTVLAEISQ